MLQPITIKIKFDSDIITKDIINSICNDIRINKFGSGYLLDPKHYLLIVESDSYITTHWEIEKTIKDLGIRDFYFYKSCFYNYEVIIFYNEEDANLFRLTECFNVVHGSTIKDIINT